MEPPWPHPVDLQGIEASLASYACDMQACLRAGNKFMGDGEAGGALDIFVLSPGELGHPEDNKTGELARKRKVED